MHKLQVRQQINNSRALSDQPIFYVYEHWRPDKERCFYVGKGQRYRAYQFKRRSPYHRNIVAVLAAAGLKPEFRIVEQNLTHSAAIALEIARILHWRQRGIRLANLTDGGDGAPGYRHTAETKAKMKKSPAEVATMSARMKGRTLSTETREKIRSARTGKPLPNSAKQKLRAAFIGRVFSEETRAKISAGITGRKVGPKTRALWSRQRTGRTHSTSPETRAKIAAKLKGHPVSEETRKKLSAKNRGRLPTAAQRQKLSESMKAAWVRKRALSRPIIPGLSDERVIG